MPEQKGRETYTTQPYPQAEPSVGTVERDSVPTYVERLEPQKTYEESENKSKPSKSRRFINWLQTYSQIVLSILTFFALVVMSLQWDEARQSRKLEFRAYAAVKAVRIDRINETTGLLVVVCTNTGRTPGKDAQVTAINELRETDIPEDSIPTAPDKIKSKVVLAPQVDFELFAGAIAMKPLPVATKPTESDSTNSQKGKGKAKETVPTPAQAPPEPRVEIPRNLKYYLWGTIEYTDIFDQPHKTKFCFYNVPGTPGWNACASYNSFN